MSKVIDQIITFFQWKIVGKRSEKVGKPKNGLSFFRHLFVSTTHSSATAFGGESTAREG